MEARPGCERGATFERSENGVASTLPPAGATTGQPGFAAGEMRPNGSKGRGFAVGAPARRSRDGNGKTAVRGGEAMAAKRTTAQGGFAQRNAARDFARQTQKAGPMTGQPGFAAGEMRPNGSKGRVFAVGDPARRSRDGDGKILVRGDEVMAAKRTTAQGGFAQRNAAPDFARQTQKVGPVTVRAVSPQAKCDRMGARAGAGTEAACGKRGRPPLSRG